MAGLRRRFERPARRRYVGDLREIGTRLGAVRDLDVLLEILSAYEARQSARARAGLRPVRDAWVTERDARRVELVELLGSEAFARFVAEYEAFRVTEGMRPSRWPRPGRAGPDGDAGHRLGRLPAGLSV